MEKNTFFSPLFVFCDSVNQLLETQINPLHSYSHSTNIVTLLLPAMQGIYKCGKHFKVALINQAASVCLAVLLFSARENTVSGF